MTEAPSQRPAGRLKAVARASVWRFLVPATCWAVAALAFDLPLPALRAPLACAYALGMVAVWLKAPPRRKAPATLAGLCLVLLWWFSLSPSNDRDWQSDVAALPYAEVVGNQVTIHNIRNCDYRTRDDFDLRYYDKTYDLDKLRTTDLYLVYWGSPHIAHTMVSFGFEGGDYVCFSIETRKEKGEEYSAIRGFFRQFELIYVIADERDVVRLRTNYRKVDDQVYLYRVDMTAAQSREFFLEYLARVDQLRQQPEWYNAMTDDCTTAIRAQRSADERAPWNWRMLANGYLDELLYERGNLVGNVPFPQLRKASLINEPARAADQSVDFSRRIREAAPGTHGKNP